MEFKIEYKENMLGRFPHLFGETPVLAAYDSDRHPRAITATVQLDETLRALLRNCADTHMLLKVIQREIIIDGAHAAFRKKVRELRADLEVRKKQIKEAIGLRYVEVNALHEQIQAIRRAHGKQSSQCFEEESEIRRRCVLQREEQTRAARLLLTAAKAVAAEMNTTATVTDGETESKIKAIAVECTTLILQAEADRKKRVKEIEAACKEAVEPLQQEYMEKQQILESEYKAAIASAEEETRAKITQIKERMEAEAEAIFPQIFKAYDPLTVAIGEFISAQEACVSAMTSSRAASTELVRTTLINLFAMEPDSPGEIQSPEPSGGQSSEQPTEE
jgi:hypothetical protein